jgi:hypothetical protein
MADEQGLMGIRESLDVTGRQLEGQMACVVGSVVLCEESNLLDINTSARDLPQASMRGFTTCARLTLIACFLEKLTPQAGSQLSNLASLLALFGS